MTTLEEQLERLARIGSRVTMFPIVKNKKIAAFQVNVSTTTGQGWVCATNKDPIAALREAAEQRIRVDGPGNQLPVAND